jgi:hypothetical protein
MMTRIHHLHHLDARVEQWSVTSEVISTETTAIPVPTHVKMELAVHDERPSHICLAGGFAQVLVTVRGCSLLVVSLATEKNQPRLSGRRVHGMIAKNELRHR